jgi:hypothetical protein
MRKLLGLLLPLVLVVPVCSQLQPKPAPSSTPQPNQQPPKETRAKAYVESISEARSIEKTRKSVLKIRNSLRFQTTFDALKSQNSYKGFEWQGFYEFRNPGDKTIVITDFRVNGIPPTAFEGKQLSVTTRAKPDRVTVFGNLDAINSSEELGADPAPAKLPINIPPHATQYLKIHLVLDVSSSDKVLEFPDEDEANKWLSAAIGFQRDTDGHFRCAFTGFPIEVSTADHQVLKYEPFTALIVPGCQMLIPPRPR